MPAIHHPRRRLERHRPGPDQPKQIDQEDAPDERGALRDHAGRRLDRPARESDGDGSNRQIGSERPGRRDPSAAISEPPEAREQGQPEHSTNRRLLAEQRGEQRDPTAPKRGALKEQDRGHDAERREQIGKGGDPREAVRALRKRGEEQSAPGCARRHSPEHEAEQERDARMAHHREEVQRQSPRAKEQQAEPLKQRRQRSVVAAAFPNAHGAKAVRFDQHSRKERRVREKWALLEGPVVVPDETAAERGEPDRESDRRGPRGQVPHAMLHLLHGGESLLARGRAVNDAGQNGEPEACAPGSRDVPIRRSGVEAYLLNLFFRLPQLVFSVGMAKQGFGSQGTKLPL